MPKCFHLDENGRGRSKSVEIYHDLLERLATLGSVKIDGNCHHGSVRGGHVIQGIRKAARYLGLEGVSFDKKISLTEGQQSYLATALEDYYQNWQLGPYSEMA